MAYPNIEGKYAYPSIYSPLDALNYRRKIDSREDSSSPETMVITYKPAGVAHILSLQDGLRNHYVTEGLYTLPGKDNSVGVYLSGLGASHAAMVMEKLIAHGSKRFINIGIAGSLQKDIGIGDVVICTGAIRDEGVSHHYLESDKYVYPSDRLTRVLKGKIAGQGLSFTMGTTWTIDAPFRETQPEVEQYQEEGVLTVEMETAALAAIAIYRGVEFAAAFVIADSLVDNRWRPGFHIKKVAERMKKLHEAAISVT